MRKSGQQQESKGTMVKGRKFEGQDSRALWSHGGREKQGLAFTELCTTVLVAATAQVLLEGAAICPRQREREPGGGCGSVCRAGGMSPPLQARAMPLQHVQGAARQASSAWKKSQAQDGAFQKHSDIPSGW